MQGAILLLFQQMPVDGAVLVPLPVLSEILSHKEQLLSGVAYHKEVCRLKIPELLLPASRHFLNHGTFQMHHLVMGKHQNELLRIGIAHAEGQLIMMIVSIHGIFLHIAQEIMHPSHIPFEVEA